MAEKKIKLEDVSHISVKKLASKIKAVDRQTINLKGQAAVTARKPQYALFLGAGASVESGIITAGQMMKIFKAEIFGNDCAELETDDEKEKWLKQQKWYKDGKNEYGCLLTICRHQNRTAEIYRNYLRQKPFDQERCRTFIRLCGFG